MLGGIIVKVKKSYMVFAIVVIGIMIGTFLPGNAIHQEKDSKNIGPFAIALAAPSSVSSAFPSDKAQIAAYIKLNQAIDLNAAGRAFYQLETAGDNYIIGIVRLEQNITYSKYNWHWREGYVYVHVYVDNTGWIVAYLNRTQSVGDVVYWSGFDFSSPSVSETSLSMAIKKVCDKIGVSYPVIKGDVKYYDFEFPGATKMIVAVNTLTYDVNSHQGEEHVHLEIPSSYTLYRAGYSLISDYCHEIDVDGTKVDGHCYSPNYYTKDFDILNVLTKGAAHTVTYKMTSDGTDALGGGIVLIYSEG